MFAGVANYAQVFSDPFFWQGVARVLLFGVVQIPVMLVFATILALLLDSVTIRLRRFFRLAFFLPYGIPGVIAAILWSFLYLPGLSPIVAALRSTGFGTSISSAPIRRCGRSPTSSPGSTPATTC